MRKILFVLSLLSFIVGCSTPPKPRECVGEFRPVNIPPKTDNTGAM
jgi:hypothetical protein